MLGWLLLIVAALAGLVLVVAQNGDTLDAMPAGLAAVGVIALLGGLYISAQRHRWHWERGPLLLGSILGVVALATAIWWFGSGYLGTHKTASRIEKALSNAGAVSVLVRRDEHGTFVAQGQINGTPSDFLIDTGAAAVMIRYSDAEKAGLDADGLAFSTPVKTASGTAYAAPVRLRSVSVGLIRVEDIEALVAKPGTLNENLLGMSFLRRLSSYALKGDFLTLRQ